MSPYYELHTWTNGKLTVFSNDAGSVKLATKEDASRVIQVLNEYCGLDYQAVYIDAEF